MLQCEYEPNALGTHKDSCSGLNRKVGDFTEQEELFELHIASVCLWEDKGEGHS